MVCSIHSFDLVHLISHSNSASLFFPKKNHRSGSPAQKEMQQDRSVSFFDDHAIRREKSGSSYPDDNSEFSSTAASKRAANSVQISSYDDMRGGGKNENGVLFLIPSNSLS